MVILYFLFKWMLSFPLTVKREMTIWPLYCGLSEPSERKVFACACGLWRCVCFCVCLSAWINILIHASVLDFVLFYQNYRLLEKMSKIMVRGPADSIFGVHKHLNCPALDFEKARERKNNMAYQENKVYSFCVCVQEREREREFVFVCVCVRLYVREFVWYISIYVYTCTCIYIYLCM